MTSDTTKPAKIDRLTCIWGFTKKIILASALLSILLNVWTMRRLNDQFESDMKELNEMETSIRSRVLSSLKNGNNGNGANSNKASKVIPVLELLEKIEKSIRPPQAKKEKNEKVVILGKGFILKRDFEIWDYTFSTAEFNPVKTSKQDLAQHQHDDWLVMKCLDLFDGKSHCIEPSDLPTLQRYQKVSRLYGLRKTLWNKDRFCDTMSSALKGFDRDNHQEFVFPCWLLPGEFFLG